MESLNRERFDDICKNTLVSDSLPPFEIDRLYNFLNEFVYELAYCKIHEDFVSKLEEIKQEAIEIAKKELREEVKDMIG